MNRPFPVRPNYYAVGGVITSVTHWGKKCDAFIHKFVCGIWAVMRVFDIRCSGLRTRERLVLTVAAQVKLRGL